MIRQVFSLSRQRSLTPVAMVTVFLVAMYVMSDVWGRFDELNYKIHALSQQLKSHTELRSLDRKDSGGMQPKIPELDIKTADLATLKHQEDSKYINPHNFDYILNNVSICSGLDNLAYVIYVHTGPRNFERRQTLRDTWAQNDIFLGESSRIVFFLGTIDEEDTQTKIAEEFRLHGDIIQENFHDSYHNLTYKAIGALKWVSKYCSNAKYVFKTDDDTFVNTFMLRDILATTHADMNRFIMCLVFDNMAILRPKKKDSCLKWCIDDHMFHGSTYYPRYCSGAAYFFSGDVISDMYTASLTTPFFWVDDVYITGLLTKKIPGINWIKEDRRYRYRLNEFHENYQNTSYSAYMMVTLVQNRAQMKTTWNLALEKLTEGQRKLVTNEKYEKLLKESRDG